MCSFYCFSSLWETDETLLQRPFMPSDFSELAHFRRRHNAFLLEIGSIKPLEASRAAHPAIKTQRANQLIA